MTRTQDQEDKDRRLADSGRQKAHRERRKEERDAYPVDDLVDPRENRRAEVLSKELARLAVRYGGHGRDEDGQPWRPNVLAFREDYLGGRVLTEAEARSFRESPAIYLLSLQDFRTRGIPLASHRAHASPLRSTFAEGQARYEWTVDIQWEDQQTTVPVVRYSHTDLKEHMLPESSDWSTHSALSDSVFADLYRLTHELARAYLWKTNAAAWFVLTGTPPSTPCIRASRELPNRPSLDHEQDRLHLSIYPWVSARTVMKVYSDYQHRLLGRENRAPRKDRLELLDFVSERRHEGWPWRRILSAWNRTYPEDAYESSGLRNFQRDFHQIYDLVVFGRGQPRKPPRKHP